MMNNFFSEIYKKSITNLSCSILKYFNVSHKHETIKEVDDILNKNKNKNIVVILLDGLGSKILSENLKEDYFLNKYKLLEINSVLPSTTVASTTSFLSSLDPIEHGWLGWDMYFKNIDKTVTVFTNNIKDTNVQAESYNVAQTKLPYKSIDTLINEKNPEINTILLFPFGQNKYTSIQDMTSKIQMLCNNGKRNFIYAYIDNPDDIMHKTGTSSIYTKRVIKQLNDEIERLCNNIKDTTVIVTADHGHIDSSSINISEYPDFKETLKRDISIESRACAFFVKEDKENEFERLFKEYFKDSFILLTKQETIDNHVFGFGEENVCFKNAIGDYLALAVGNKYFRYDNKGKVYVAQHAGISKDETTIPVIIINV